MGLKSLNCGRRGDWGASQFPRSLILVLYEHLLGQIMMKPSGGDIPGTTTLFAGNMVRYRKHGSPHGEDWLSWSWSHKVLTFGNGGGFQIPG